MVAISVAVDRQAALMLGNDLKDRVTIEVTPDQIGQDLWPTLVKMLHTGPAVPVLNDYGIRVAEATPDALKAALVAHVKQGRDLADKVMRQYRESLETARAAASADPVPADLHVGYNVPGVDIAARYTGWQRKIPSIYDMMDSRTTLTDDERAERAAIKAEIEQLANRSAEEIAALNAAALEAALPRLREECAAKQAEIAAEEAAKDRRRMERAAERLRAGVWEMETRYYGAKGTRSVSKRRRGVPTFPRASSQMEA